MIANMTREVGQHNTLSLQITRVKLGNYTREVSILTVCRWKTFLEKPL